MKRKSILGLLALMILIGSLGAAQAFGGNFFGMNSETRDTIINAIKSKDYSAWKEAMETQLTEENFNKLVERHEAMSERQAQREAMEKAVQEGDYEAWKKASENLSVTQYKILDENDFKILVQLHQAKQDGNYTKVKELSEQLGLPGGFERHGLPDNNAGLNMTNHSQLPRGFGKHRVFEPSGREG